MQIFKNASFVSCEDRNRLYGVLVEDKGKILHLGDAIPEKYAGAVHHDLKGMCVVPAFADTHIHFQSFSLFHSTLDTRNAADFGELAELIGGYVAGHPREKVVLGFGCSEHTVKERRLPSREDLDKITARPLLIVKYDGHAAVANSSLLKILPPSALNARGFDRTTGWFLKGAFYTVINSITRSVSPLKILRSIILGSDYMARRGIALVHPVEGVGFPRDIDVDIMRAAAWGLPQTFRTYFQTMDLKKVLRRNLPRVGGCFATALDGCFGSQDAALREPYANNSSNRGMLFYPQETVTKFVMAANRAGLQVAMHAVGDAAVEQALNAYEDALSDFPREDHRHVLIHADIIDDAQIERAASMKISIALQTPFLFRAHEPADYLESLIGKRLKDFIPLKNLIDAGITIGNGSDGPCTYPDAIFGIHAACNHPNPDQRIRPLDALKMATNWAARISFDEKDRGTLSVGKRADFAVLDRNPLGIPVDTIKDTRVRALYLSGRLYDGQKISSGSLLGRSIRNRLFPERAI